MVRSAGICCAGVLALFSSSLLAQGLTGLISQAEANRVGLVRMWFSQVSVDTARGEVVQWIQQVSTKESVAVFDVVYAGGKFSFRETDLDRFGNVIGKEQAQRLAELKVQDLQELKVEAKLVTQNIPRITLYAVTDSGVIHSIDAETGRTRWKAGIGNPRHPTEGAAANDDYVVAVNGSNIFLLKAATGEFVWQRKMDGVPGAPPAVSSAMAFVPLVNGLMAAFRLDDPRQPPTNFRSLGRALVRPIYTGTNIAWPTDRGHMYVTGAIHNRINFRLEANDTIVAPAAFLPPNQLVVASVDGFVYCLQETNGILQWRFSTGEPIVEGPTAFGEDVYVTTVDGTLFAINAKSNDAGLGQERWTTKQIERVVSASPSRLYVISDAGRLMILDRASGARLGAVTANFNELPFTNHQTDRIFLGTKTGVIQCLRESSQDYPHLHVRLEAPQEEAPQRKPLRQTSEEEAPSGAPADPFGGGAKPSAIPSDPFGGDSGTPKPEPPPSAEDPFGE